MKEERRLLAGWGGFRPVDCKVVQPRTEADVRTLVLAGPLIARGMGRSYGDSAINPHCTVDMRHFNRMLAFDASTGLLTAEAGVTLDDVVRTFLPRGWFPMVTPGTRFVSLGGMVAADVHGKNHHVEGSFADHVESLDIMVADGSVQTCSRSLNSELFEATLGGMGLTGVVLRVVFRLRRVQTGWIRQETRYAPSLQAALTALGDDTESRPYSVAWIDCQARGAALGRSLVYIGDHAGEAELGPREKADRFAMKRRKGMKVPFNLPSWSLNRVTVRLFNQLYAWQGRRQPATRLVDWQTYFYPLDSIESWNRIYGRRGFLQFQCIIPTPQAERALNAILSATSDAGLGSFLAVLKRMGPGRGMLSFPMAGYTLALDFPASARAIALVEQLNDITAQHGGRIYLAKDAVMTPDQWQHMAAGQNSFADIRRDTQGADTFVSAQSERLGL